MTVAAPPKGSAATLTPRKVIALNNVANPESYRCGPRPPRCLVRLLTAYADHDADPITHYCAGCGTLTRLRPWRSVIEPGLIRYGPYLCAECFPKGPFVGLGVRRGAGAGAA